MSADRVNNKKLTINNFDKLKDRHIGLYKIDVVREDEDMYQLRARHSLLFRDESLVITISRNETTSLNYRHVLTRFDTTELGNLIMMEIDWVLPIHLIRDMDKWLDKMDVGPDKAWKIIRKQ